MARQHQPATNRQSTMPHTANDAPIRSRCAKIALPVAKCHTCSRMPQSAEKGGWVTLPHGRPDVSARTCPTRRTKSPHKPRNAAHPARRPTATGQRGTGAVCKPTDRQNPTLNPTQAAHTNRNHVESHGATAPDRLTTNHPTTDPTQRPKRKPHKPDSRSSERHRAGA